MKFYLKITAFLTLILISKFTRETENVTSATDESKLGTPAVLTTYHLQGDVPDRLEKAGQQKVQAIYK